MTRVYLRASSFWNNFSLPGEKQIHLAEVKKNLLHNDTIIHYYEPQDYCEPPACLFLLTLPN